MRADAPVKLQRGNDLRPVSADLFAKLRQRVRRGQRGDKAHVDCDLCELGAFVAHRQDRAAVRFKEDPVRDRKRLRRIGAADDKTLGLERSLHCATEDERLNLVVEDPFGTLTRSGEAGWDLR